MEKGFPAGLVIGVLLLLFWLVAGTLGFRLIEGWSLRDAAYMTIITLSTVGYEEVQPLSPAGRLFASFLIVAGLGTAVYTFTRLGQLVLEGELLGILGRRRMRAVLQNLHDHFIVCGYGRIGKPVAEGLARAGKPFCVVDRSAEVAQELMERNYPHVLGDPTAEEVLREAGMERARTLLALFPSDADNLYVTIAARTLNPRITVIARAADERAEMVLTRSGAARVISPNRIASARVLHAALRPAVVDFMEIVTHRAHLPLSLEEVPIREGAPLAGKTLAQAEVRRRCGVIVVAIKRRSGEMLFNPAAEEVLRAGDVLVAMGQEEDLQRLAAVCAAA